MRSVLKLNLSERHAWLSLTPEPERELPRAVATMRAGAPAAAEAVEREQSRIERVVVRARRRRWLAYMHEVGALIKRSASSADPSVAHARAVAAEVIRNHHGLLLGLPGRYPDLTEGAR
jgi:hypothetical protein